MKLALIGGHLTPAVATIEYLQKNYSQIELCFIGTTTTQQSSNQKSMEEKTVTDFGVPFTAFRSSKLGINSLALLQIIRVLPAVFRARSLLQQLKPDCVLSFGGYLALPVAVAARLLSIPVITHDQTAAPGIATRVIARFAQRVLLSYPESALHFPENKTRVIGNLLRPSLLEDAAHKPDWFKADDRRPLLYITGGNQGSATINATVSEIVEEMTADWNVIHQTGASTEQHPYQKNLSRVKEKLPTDQKERYVIREWITTQELAWIYAHAAAAISRSGANTTQELHYFGIPTIFIPLSFSHNQEQLRNAGRLAERQAALLIPQSELTPQNLVSTLQVLKEHSADIKLNLANIPPLISSESLELLAEEIMNITQAKS